MKSTLFVNQLAQQLLPVYEAIETATDNAWWIVQAITGLSKAELVSQQTITLSAEQEKKLALWKEKLINEHMPLHYLIGTVPFLNLELKIVPPILIPRPETEAWVADTIQQLQAHNSSPYYILDLCTGSGCIALALAQAFPHSTVIATDINPAALALAQENAHKNQIKNVQLVRSDLFADVPCHQYDCIASNPPYIGIDEWQELAPTVKLWEDRQALVADDAGYALIEKIIEQAPSFLATNGRLIIEIGHTQGSRVAAYYRNRGFEEVAILRDLHGNERVVQGLWKVPSPNCQ